MVIEIMEPLDPFDLDNALKPNSYRPFQIIRTTVRGTSDPEDEDRYTQSLRVLLLPEQAWWPMVA
jgi:hypothetical protein